MFAQAVDSSRNTVHVVYSTLSASSVVLLNSIKEKTVQAKQAAQTVDFHPDTVHVVNSTKSVSSVSFIQLKKL